ncbi:MAG: CotH kinase family protein [Gemmataceae bacterium]
MPCRLLPALALGLALPAPAAEKPPDVFGLTQVHAVHLTVSAKDWQAMQPTRGGFGFGGPPGKPPAKEADPGEDRKARGSFGFDFAYVKGAVEIDGRKFPEVGLRFKGGGSYATSQQGLKRPFKIEFDRYVEDQSWAGLKKLSLNNNSMDPTGAREALSYAVYRAASVPAPRTAFAEVSLTVPGKYDKTVLGLYTLVEPIEKPFLKERFGSAKGLLLKPERVGPLEHLGSDWSAYEGRYQPKTAASKAQQKRFIDFTKLVQQADDAEFRKRVEGYLDVEKFLRFLATTVALSSLDSFLTGAHNYYIYLDPKGGKFVFLPWDLDHSLGGFFPVGSPDQLADLSIRQPHTGRNRLVERLLADEAVFARYKKHLAEVVEKHFTAERTRDALAAVNKAIAPVQAREKQAAKERKEPAGMAFGPPGFRQPPPDLEKFVARRVASIKDQIEGKSKGTAPRGFGFGPPPKGGFGPGQFLAKPALDALDANKDGKLSRGEALAGVKALFKACDPDGKGEVDQKQLTMGLDKVLPKPPAPPGGMKPPAGFTPPSLAGIFARGLLDRVGKDGKVTEKQLVEAADELFVKMDKDKNGTLDTNELSEAINAMMPRPPIGAPGGPANRPAGRLN